MTTYSEYEIRLSLDEVVRVVPYEGDTLSGELSFEVEITGEGEKAVVVPSQVITRDRMDLPTLATIIRDGRTQACRQISELHRGGEEVDWVRFDTLVEHALAGFFEARARVEPVISETLSRTFQTVRLDLIYVMREDAPDPAERDWYFLSCLSSASVLTTNRYRA